MAEGTHNSAIRPVSGTPASGGGSATRRPGRILLVEVDPLVRESVARTLGRAEHDVVCCADAAGALSRLAVERFDLLLVELKSAGMRGAELVAQTRRLRPEPPVVVMTAFAGMHAALEAVRRGAYDCIQKPFEKEEILVLVDRALEHARLRLENQALREAANLNAAPRPFVGKSAAMLEACAAIERAAPTCAPVLVRGEIGTGRSMAARLIHASGGRRRGPLLSLNCAGSSESQLAIDLLGQEADEPGSEPRQGRLELADQGSLVLEGLEHASAALCALLWRTLREQAFRRQGGRIIRRAEARVIGITTDPAVSFGATTIDLPPLRQRREDIPDLVRHFLHQASKRTGEAFRHVEAEAVRLLQKYPWPGNVRELEAVVERAILLETQPGVIRALTVSAILGEARPPVVGRAFDPSGPAVDPLDRLPLAEVEKRVILDTLAKFEGHRAKTATALGIGIRTLGIKLKKWREEGELADLPYA